MFHNGHNAQSKKGLFHLEGIDVDTRNPIGDSWCSVRSVPSQLGFQQTRKLVVVLFIVLGPRGDTLYFVYLFHFLLFIISTFYYFWGASFGGAVGPKMLFYQCFS